jgi:hypothetical protein
MAATPRPHTCTIDTDHLDNTTTDVYTSSSTHRAVVAEGQERMRDKTIFTEKLKTLGKLAELGGADAIIDQTITKLLDYATDRHRKDLEDIAAKLRALEERFGMTSDLFSQKFHRGALGDDEEFFRWDALLEMQRRVAQRLALLLADSAA